MSGSGSGGSWVGSSDAEGSGGNQPSCYDLVERVHVSSPDRAVAEEIERGDILDVVVDQDDDTPLLLLVTPDGRTLGSVVPAKMARLIACILVEGVTYMAVVLEKEGGLIKVEIRAKE